MHMSVYMDINAGSPLFQSGDSKFSFVIFCDFSRFFMSLCAAEKIVPFGPLVQISTFFLENGVHSVSRSNGIRFLEHLYRC